MSTRWTTAVLPQIGVDVSGMLELIIYRWKKALTKFRIHSDKLRAIVA
jgi:hypothetical protein